MYGKGNPTTAIITGARTIVNNHYGLPTTLTRRAVGDRIKWLLDESVFRFGGLNLEV